MSKRVVPVSEKELESFRLNSVPQNTMKSTEYALRLYESWRLVANEPSLNECTPIQIKDLIPKFITEIRTRKGEGSSY